MGHIHIHISHIYVKGTVLPFSPFIGNSPKYINQAVLVVKNLPAKVLSLGGDDPLEAECMATIQYSCLENPIDRGAWRATAHGILKHQTQLK